MTDGWSGDLSAGGLWIGGILPVATLEAGLSRKAGPLLARVSAGVDGAYWGNGGGGPDHYAAVAAQGHLFAGHAVTGSWSTYLGPSVGVLQPFAATPALRDGLSMTFEVGGALAFYGSPEKAAPWMTVSAGALIPTPAEGRQPLPAYPALRLKLPLVSF